ncbi:MAG: hypothetical protein ABH950_02665, partial [Candidatus Altiarchaeota archaeon]
LHKLDRKFIIAIIIAVLVVVNYPVVNGVMDGSIPNRSGLWTQQLSFDAYPDLETDVRVVDNSYIVGKLESENSISSSWNVSVYTLPFMSEQMKKLGNARMVITGNPVSTLDPFRSSEVSPTESELGFWQDVTLDEYTKHANNLPEGIGPWLYPIVQSYDGMLHFSSSGFSSERRNFFVIERDLNFTVYPDVTFSVRWKSTEHIGRLELQTYDNHTYQILHESAENLTGTGGAYSKDWDIQTFDLPDYAIVKRIIIGMDSGDFVVSGKQDLYIDYFGFSRAEPSKVQILLNENLIFEEPLAFKGKDGLYTFDQYRLAVLEHSKPYYGKTINIPFDLDLLKVDNQLEIRLGEYTSWNISYIGISIDLPNYDGLSPMIFAGVPSIVYRAILLGLLFVEVFVFLILINKLRGWIDSTSPSKVESEK